MEVGQIYMIVLREYYHRNEQHKQNQSQKLHHQRLLVLVRLGRGWGVGKSCCHHLSRVVGRVVGRRVVNPEGR